MMAEAETRTQDLLARVQWRDKAYLNGHPIQASDVKYIMLRAAASSFGPLRDSSPE